jgi:hypothetical protein
MNIFRYINLYVFLITFALGIFAVYIFSDPNKHVMVYPTHENAHLLQYKDQANNCFSIEETEVPCPRQNEISTVPPQVSKA